MNKVYAYCRVSSKLCHSLETQEKIIRKYVLDNGMRVSRLYREQASAYKNIPLRLSTLRTMKNGKLIFMAVDRFMRNVAIGTQFMEELLRNNNEIHFIREGIILNELNMQQWDTFLYHLNRAQEESDIKSERIKFRIICNTYY